MPLILGLSMIGIGLLTVLLLWLFFDNPAQKAEQVTWRRFVKNYLQTGLVRRVEIVNNEWAQAVMIDSSIPSVWMSVTNGFEQDFDNEVQQLTHDVELTYKHEIQLSSFWDAALSFIKFLPYLVFLIVLLVSFVEIFNGKQNGGCPKETLSNALFKNPNIINSTDISERFSDVVGCDNAKLEIMELVSFLKNPAIYLEMGAKAPRGALLTGPPGTGKTILAKAAAGEAGVPFISMSGSEFNEIFVGMGALKIRELFSLARKNRPCIIFIDEIDSIGRKRQDGKFGLASEADNTLNQLLVELDGFSSRDQVLVLAATNRADILDEALLRPGRFDRLITMPVPDIDGREELFKRYLLPIQLGTTMDKECLVKKLAFLTPGFTGAQIAQVCNDAAILAIRQNQHVVTMENFELAILRTIVGHGSSTIKLSDHERRVVAYHEAGHAVAGWFSKHADQLLKISILPLGDSLGHTQFLSRELNLYTDEQLMDQLVVAMGGRVVEKMIFGKFTTGAVHDLQKVTNIAYKSIMTFGMNTKLGPISFVDKKPMSEEVSKMIDLEVLYLVESAEKAAEELLSRHVEEIHAIAGALLDNNILSVEDIIGLIGPRPFKDKKLYKENACEKIGEEEPKK